GAMNVGIVSHIDEAVSTVKDVGVDWMLLGERLMNPHQRLSAHVAPLLTVSELVRRPRTGNEVLRDEIPHCLGQIPATVKRKADCGYFGAQVRNDPQECGALGDVAALCENEGGAKPTHGTDQFAKHD